MIKKIILIALSLQISLVHPAQMNRPATSNNQLIWQLPADINDHVLAYLLKDYEDVENLSQVCKSWKDRFISSKISQLLKYMDNTGNSSTPLIAIAADVPDILERQIRAINDKKKTALVIAEDDQKKEIKRKFEEEKQRLFDKCLWESSNYGSKNIAKSILQMYPHISTTNHFYPVLCKAILKGHCELASLLINNINVSFSHGLDWGWDFVLRSAIESNNNKMFPLIVNKLKSSICKRLMRHLEIKH